MVTNEGMTMLSFSWTAPTGLTGPISYAWRLTEFLSGGGTSVAMSGTGHTGTSITITGLKRNTQYQFAIRLSGESADADVVSAMTN